MQRICLFPGTFDPVTLGHLDIINRALPLFDKFVIGIGTNFSKDPMFSTIQRKKWFEEIYYDNPKITAEIYEGLTLDFCRKIGAKFILRGIRFLGDFEYEKSIADANRHLDASIETIFLTSEPKYSSVVSTIVRDIFRNKGDISFFVPSNVLRDLHIT
ncbi:MAG: pantetheine-phosphate adenylyltransferase [Sediminibacterium sp.]|nr:pantetheine-phosphate adenylyltransferase [Sediminibacterium sp.]